MEASRQSRVCAGAPNEVAATVFKVLLEVRDTGYAQGRTSGHSIARAFKLKAVGGYWWVLEVKVQNGKGMRDSPGD